MANNEHAINGMLDVTLEKIRQMVDSSTIIGNPITTADGSTILPVSRVSFGFTSGGSDFVSGKAPQKDLFGGGSGAGVSITPIAFLVIQEGSVRMIQLADKYSTTDRALNLVPELVDKVSELLTDKKGKRAKAEKGEEGAAEGGKAPKTLYDQDKDEFDAEAVIEIVKAEPQQ